MKTVKKRRRENKTDYLNRFKLLKSKKPRLVFRKTNRYLVVQYVTSENARDKVIFCLSSKDLLKYGWPSEFKGSLKSIPAAYLTGLMTGGKIQEEKKEIPIVDLGMLRTIHKNKIYAFLKGLIDSGIKINCPEEAFPEENRIKGVNLKQDFSKYFEQIKSKIKIK